MDICKELSLEELSEELGQYFHFCIELIYGGITIQTDNTIGIDFHQGSIIFDDENITIKYFQKAFKECDGMYWIDITDNCSVQILCFN